MDAGIPSFPPIATGPRRCFHIDHDPAGTGRVGEIHDRMPVFLESEVCDEYLSLEKVDDAAKADMVQLLTVESDRVAGTITSYDVDRKVNNTRTADPTDPTLIEPLE